MDETRVMDLSELPDFRSMERDGDQMPKNWGFCMGGQHLERDQWEIMHVHEDFTTDRYPLPLWVTPLIRGQRLNGIRENQQKLRSALGL